ncbi:SA1788 family PVL leukocidin-associated protein [Staphylococcus sp. FSL H8-0121]|uniref:SA1788 family PVL leukocidin-associated protein n=1 Tax=Staphylococcus TaxID=1279 RepID=UPI0012B72795|nr:SA1788 family PVL leukocidin-associated protein [Staphylococcus pasteuri]
MLKTTIKVKNEKRELTNLELQKMQDNALDHGIVSNRIRDNWTEEEVFNVPKGMSRTQYAEYKSLKNLEIANKNDKSNDTRNTLKKPWLYKVRQLHGRSVYVQNQMDNNSFVKLKKDCYGRMQRV